MRWLDRRIAAPGPFLTLCLTEAEFEAAMKHCGVTVNGPWLTNVQVDATSHVFRCDRGLCVVVCISGFLGRDPIEVAGLLVHEAVHAWQAYAEDIGEKSPGDEQEAYAIQSIAQELMAEFARRALKA